MDYTWKFDIILYTYILYFAYILNIVRFILKNFISFNTKIDKFPFHRIRCQINQSIKIRTAYCLFLPYKVISWFLFEKFYFKISKYIYEKF